MSLRTAIRSDWGVCLGLVLLLGITYGLLYNPYWAPAGGDDAVYVAVARSLLSGEGYRFNGLPEMVIPPGWPILLALAMWISPSFAVLNLLATLFLLGTVFTWYWIVRRFASPPASFVIVLLSSTLLAVHWGASHLLTEPLFGLLLGTALLLVFQIRENPSGLLWRVILLAIVAAALVAVRLAGLLMVPLLAGIALSGQWRPAVNRGWLATLVVVTAMASTFVFLRYSNWRDMLQGQSAVAQATGPGDANGETSTLPLDMDGRPVPAATKHTSQPRIIRLSSRSLGWLASSGEWFAKLLWPLGNSGRNLGPIRLLSITVGTLLMVPLATILVYDSRRREWIWIGLTLYCLYFIATWGIANERYLVPIAMLLVAGMYRGAQVLTAGTRLDIQRGLGRAVLLLFLVSVFGYNLGTLGINIWAARAADFYTRYHAAEYKELLAAGMYLNSQGIADNEVAVNGSVANVATEWIGHSLGLRAMHLLTARRIQMVPIHVCTSQPTEDLIRWSQQHNIRYYLCRMPTSPWRVWHFRIPWIQERLTGQPAIWNPDWVLYRVDGEKAEPIDLNPWFVPLTTVPTLRTDRPTATPAWLAAGSQQTAVHR